MAVPDYRTLMLPILRLSASGEIRNRDAVDRISDEFGLTDEERGELLPSGHQTRIAHRVSWAVKHLEMAHLVERPRRAHFTITPAGKKILSERPGRIDIVFLKAISDAHPC